MNNRQPAHPGIKYADGLLRVHESFPFTGKGKTGSGAPLLELWRPAEPKTGSCTVMRLRTDQMGLFGACRTHQIGFLTDTFAEERDLWRQRR